MKPCFVLNEDERKIRHEKRTTKCSNNKKISNEEQTSSSNMAICRSPEDIFTMDDMLFILGTIHKLRRQQGREGCQPKSFDCLDWGEGVGKKPTKARLKEFFVGKE